MNRYFSPFSLLFCSLSLIFCLYLPGCTDKTSRSAYSDILNKEPFSSLTDSIAKAPENDNLYFQRAVLLNQKDYAEPALADFRKAWSLKKEEKYALGISTILQETKPAESISFLNEALKDLPASVLLRLSLARAYDAQNKTGEALAVCQDLLQHAPERVDVLKLTASLQERKGNKPESVRFLEKAYSLAPFDIDLNYMLALQYAETKNGKLLSLCDSLIRIDTLKVHGEPYYYKGIYYSNINEKQKAIAQFNEAILHDYNFIEAHIEKGAVLFELKKYEDALKVFNLALTISPNVADTYYWIAKCEQALGQKQDARLNYQRAYGLDKTFTAAKDSADKLK